MGMEIINIEVWINNIESDLEVLNCPWAIQLINPIWLLITHFPAGFNLGSCYVHSTWYVVRFFNRIILSLGLNSRFSKLLLIVLLVFVVHPKTRKQSSPQKRSKDPVARTISISPLEKILNHQ